MSLLTKLFGKPQKEIKEFATEPGDKKSPANPEPIGTTLRPPVDATRITKKKPGPERTALELADEQGWEVKTLGEIADIKTLKIKDVGIKISKEIK